MEFASGMNVSAFYDDVEKIERTKPARYSNFVGGSELDTDLGSPRKGALIIFRESSASSQQKKFNSLIKILIIWTEDRNDCLHICTDKMTVHRFRIQYYWTQPVRVGN